MLKAWTGRAASTALLALPVLGVDRCAAPPADASTSTRAATTAITAPPSSATAIPQAEETGPTWPTTTRQVFRATPAGRTAAARAAVASSADQRTVVHPMRAGLATMQLIAVDDYGDAPQHRLIWISERIAGVRAAEQAQGPLPHAAHEVFSSPLSLLETERSWPPARVAVRHE